MNKKYKTLLDLAKKVCEGVMNYYDSKDEFADGLKKYLMYYFWSKCQYEIILSPWTGRADDIKIDVYDQIMMNFDRFVDYVWSFEEVVKHG